MDLVSSYDLPSDGSWLNLEYLSERLGPIPETFPEKEIPPALPARPGRVDLCIFHAPCPDGTAAAFAVGRAYPDCEFFGVNRGSDETDTQLPENIEGKNVLIVDFVYSRDLMEVLIGIAASVVVVDHHTSEHDLLEELSHIHTEEKFSYIYSETVCAAVLAWLWLLPHEALPPLYEYINDNDTGAWQLPNVGWLRRGLGVGTPVIGPGRSLFPDFELFSEGIDAGKNFIISRMVMGMLAAEIEWRDIRSDVQRAAFRRLRVAPEYWCKIVNVSSPNSGGIHSAILEEYGIDFSMTYFRVDCNRSWKCSLRSRQDGTVNVGSIAALLGGGGHACAASFTLRCDNIEDIFLPNEDGYGDEEWDDYWGWYD